jgi:hypothetical protein
LRSDRLLLPQTVGKRGMYKQKLSHVLGARARALAEQPIPATRFSVVTLHE